MKLKEILGSLGYVPRWQYWLWWLGLAVSNWIWAQIVQAVGLGLLAFLVWAVATVLIWLAVCFGRAQDMGRSGWMSLMMLIPLVNLFIFLWLGFSRSVDAD